MKYYKFLDEHNRGPYSTYDFTEYLPEGDEPGAWLPEVENLVTCESGYHASTKEHILNWLDCQMWEVEYKHEPTEVDDKVNGSCIRFVRRIDTWNDRTARLFAVWCAREALKLIDEPDPRSIEACDVAERYANGKATQDELAAARNAAWSAAGDAAWSAASTAVYAARSAAVYAARSAAVYAAVYAARDAAWSAARDAQSNKLYEMLEI